MREKRVLTQEATPQSQDSGAETMQSAKSRMTANQKQRRRLLRELESLHSLALIVVKLREKVNNLGEDEMVNFAAEDEVVERVAKSLFTARNHLATKAASLKRLDHYLHILAGKQAALQHLLEQRARFHQVLEETKAIASQLQKMRKRKNKNHEHLPGS